jgi:phage terminase large subunit-like protein
LGTIEYAFDEQAAARAVEFFPRYLRHVKGPMAGQPFELEPWQAEKTRQIFGWKRLVPGLELEECPRKIETVWIEIPKKNGKSTWAAGLGLYLAFADGEPGAEVYNAACDREQASIVFDISRTMVEQSPSLDSRCKPYRRHILGPRNSIYRVLSAEAYTKHGINPHGIIFDEIVWQPNRELYDTLVGAQVARRQPLFVAITTAGVYAKESIGYQLHTYAESVLDGKVEDPTWYAVIYAADPEADWQDPTVWAAANPNLGIALAENKLAKLAREAAEMPSYLNTFKRLHLNIWTASVSAWLEPDKWDACDADPGKLAGRTVYAGLDLASTRDLCALVVVSQDENGYWDIWLRAWVPEATIGPRSKTDRVPYDYWAEKGYIETTAGEATDYQAIRMAVNELAEATDLVMIGYDPWNARQLTGELLDYDGLPMVEFRQGYASLSDPSKFLERLVLTGKLRHGGNPVLAWAAGNVSISTDPAGNIKPNKQQSREKIDPITALVVALGCTMLEDPAPPSKYENEDLVIL